MSDGRDERAETELTARQRALLVRFVGLMLVAMIALIAMTLVSSYQTRFAIIRTQRIGCERGKLDRAASAAGWTAHRIYIERVTGAQSVQEDVKRAARVAERTYVRISRDFTARARLDCKDAFPDPPVVKFAVVQ